MQKLFNDPALASLLFDSKWMMTEDAKQALLAQLSLSNSIELPDYEKESCDLMDIISSEVNVEANLTRDFHETTIPSGSIAYHRVFGTILADTRWSWYFSTKQYEADLLAADANPQIIAHFEHMSTGGGEAWYLDRLFETKMKLKKPVVTLYEKRACSAGLYISAPSKKRYALTQNCIIGSLGTMVSFWNIIPYYEKLGLIQIEEYATKSDLKNKLFKDLINGKPEEYKKKELDPLQEQFESHVRTAITAIGKLPEDHESVRGATFDTPHAVEIGLSDGVATLNEALAEAQRLGNEYSGKASKQNKALSLIS